MAEMIFGKSSDNKGIEVTSTKTLYLKNICSVCHEPQLGSHYHESDDDELSEHVDAVAFHDAYGETL